MKDFEHNKYSLAETVLALFVLILVKSHLFTNQSENQPYLNFRNLSLRFSLTINA
jgi:hypothetical protein